MIAASSPSSLGRALLDRRELGFAVVLDGDAGGLDSLADGVLDGDDLVAVGVLDRLVELRLGVRDPAVFGERVRLKGSPTLRCPPCRLPA